MDDVVMISDLVWIPRGIAKEKPDKVKLDDEAMKELISGGAPETSEGEEESDKEDAKRDVEMIIGEDGDGEENVIKKKKGLRGSAIDIEMKDDDEGVEKYLKEYDEEEGDKDTGMRGIAMYSNNKDDPYVTLHVDSDEEEEKEEFNIKSDDNMVAVAKIHKGEYTLEIYVYNEKGEDWYCHHDYILDAPPLCLESIQYDPGNEETKKGNLIAVGTMDQVINIWDLDIVNAVEPFITLGSKSKKFINRKKRDGSAQGHGDAVLSIAWNKIEKNILASGGADKQIILWDLDETKMIQGMGDKNGEVQSINWHPIEASFLIAGTMKGSVEVIDCREPNAAPSASWRFPGQIEKVIWDHFNPYSAYLSSDDGKLRHIDMRKTGEVIWEGVGHDDAIGGLSLSTITRGLMITVGQDQMLCVWKVEENGSLSKIHSEKLHIGTLHSARFNPDVSTVCAIGGSADDLIRVFDVAKIESVIAAFS